MKKAIPSQITRFFAAALALVGLTAIPSGAQANVSVKSGDFFVVYTDILYPGGFEPKIARVYNSKATYSGMFGAGWGNDYEVYLTVSADGSVVVHEYGGGAENRFSPLAFNGQELKSAVEMISVAAKAGGQIGSDQQLASYKQKLASDAVFRNKEWENLIRLGKVQPRQLANGTQLKSNRFSYQYITKVADGYVRNFDNGRIEKFDLRGSLKKILDKNNNFIELTYSKDGRKIEKIVDNFNRKLFFTYDTRGLVSKIEGEDKKTAEYKYNELGELAWSKDSGGNTYAFKYSPDRLHNMTEIAYSDKTTMQMAYFDKNKLYSIKSVKERDGTVTEYDYKFEDAARTHYEVSIATKGSDKKVISTSSYEYVIKSKPDGEAWTQKVVAVLDGEKTETTFNEAFGLPVLIKKGNEETAFEYDARGHVTKKTTPLEITELQYDQRAGKVSRVAKTSKVDKSKTWSEFSYDEKGNLVTAKNNEGKGVRLIYDNVGRIATMVDQNKRQIKFKYNENSKPTEITDPALGSIKVSYTQGGEIKDVDSAAGRKIAVQVTSAFQNLLDIIRPAGVSLAE